MRFFSFVLLLIILKSMILFFRHSSFVIILSGFKIFGFNSEINLGIELLYLLITLSTSSIFLNVIKASPVNNLFFPFINLINVIFYIP